MNLQLLSKRALLVLISAVLGGAARLPAPAGPEITLVSIASAPERQALIVAMTVPEPEQFRSLRRVELSLRDSRDREFFRGMVNCSSYVDPIPPTAFGVFPVGEKDKFSIYDVRSAGPGAIYPAGTRLAELLPETSMENTNGMLRIVWWVKPKPWPPADPAILVFAKALLPKAEDGTWVKLGDYTLNPEKTPVNPVAVPVADQPAYSVKFDK